MLYFFEEYSLYYFYVDVINYFFLLLIYFNLYKIKLITKDILLFTSLLSISPFLINNFIIDWWFIPDQLKYLKLSNEFRNIDFSVNKITVLASSMIFSIFPLPFIESYNSIGFINRGIISLFTILLLNKKVICKNFFYFVNLVPSVIFYSSVSLRDTLSLVLIISCAYLLINQIKNTKIYILTFFLLFLIKPINFYLLLVVFFLYYILFNKSFSKKAKLIIIFFSIIILSLIFDNVLHYFNFRRYYMLIESNEFNKIFQQNIELNFYSLKILLKDMLNFIISPLTTISSTRLLGILQVFENLFLYSFLGLLYYELFSINKRKFYFWISILLMFFLVYGSLVFSDGSIARYRYVVLVFLIFAVYQEIKKNKFKFNEKKNYLSH